MPVWAGRWSRLRIANPHIDSRLGQEDSDPGRSSRVERGPTYRPRIIVIVGINCDIGMGFTRDASSSGARTRRSLSCQWQAGDHHDDRRVQTDQVNTDPQILALPAQLEVLTQAKQTPRARPPVHTDPAWNNTGGGGNQCGNKAASGGIDVRQQASIADDLPQPSEQPQVPPRHTAELRIS
jgi:hypothetical protein